MSDTVVEIVVRVVVPNPDNISDDELMEGVNVSASLDGVKIHQDDVSFLSYEVSE